MRKVKIGVIGAHGTGKSTLVLGLAARIKEFNPGLKVGIVSEVARSCPWPVNKETTEEGQTWIFHKQTLEELEAAKRNDVVICDRTVLDNLTYAYRAGFHNVVKNLLTVAVAWMRTYDLILFVRPGDYAPTDDGFRDSDKEFQREIDCQINDWLRLPGLPGVNHHNIVQCGPADVLPVYAYFVARVLRGAA